MPAVTKDSVRILGTKLQVVQGDLTTIQADCIVNAANEQLDLRDGLAKAIADAGGEQIERECGDYIKLHGHLRPGEIYVSTPGKLQCKKLIHAVGPIWSGGGTQKENCLREAIHESLLATERLGLASLAFPALSAGIRNFPNDVCAEIIATTVADYITDHTETRVKTVSLVHPDDQGVAAFCKSFSPFKVQGSGIIAKPECDYWELCHRFFKTLGIKDVVVNKKFNICYCTKCHSSRKDKDYYTRGKPAKTYGIPIGWIRIGIHTPVQAQMNDSFTEWHRAYHGTKAEYVPDILKVGYLLLPGDVALGKSDIAQRSEHFDENTKPEGFNTLQVFLSPSIRYSGNDSYAACTSYEDEKTKKTYKGKVAFQVLVSPDAYEEGPTTIHNLGTIDPKFDNSKIEWSTTERGSVILYGLLLHLEEDKQNN